MILWVQALPKPIGKGVNPFREVVQAVPKPIGKGVNPFREVAQAIPKPTGKGMLALLRPKKWLKRR
jgi:hypothetical protein